MGFTSYDRVVSRFFVQFIMQGAPIQMRAMHSVFESLYSIGRLFFPFVLWMMGGKLKLIATATSGTNAEILEQLENQYNLTGRDLPPALGGSYRNELDDTMSSSFSTTGSGNYRLSF